jgi:membrane protein implicated in regulation of membrane protease activity
MLQLIKVRWYQVAFKNIYKSIEHVKKKRDLNFIYIHRLLFLKKRQIFPCVCQTLCNITNALYIYIYIYIFIYLFIKGQSLMQIVKTIWRLNLHYSGRTWVHPSFFCCGSLVFCRSLFVFLSWIFFHCIVCSSSVYVFLSPLWYLQIFLTPSSSYWNIILRKWISRNRKLKKDKQDNSQKNHDFVDRKYPIEFQIKDTMQI